MIAFVATARLSSRPFFSGFFVFAAALSAPLVLVGSVGAQAAPEPDELILSPDPELQAGLQRLLTQAPYRGLMRNRRLSVALVDLTDPERPRYAGADEDRMRYAASLPKIAILLGAFDQIDKGRLDYTPELRRKMEGMIRRSDNALSSEMIRIVGFPAIAAALRDPKHKLYDPGREGGLWVGRGYGSGVGLWRRDPISNISHGATARQTARFLVMMNRGELVSPWASAEMKAIMGQPAIRHKFVRGLGAARPNSHIYRKSGTWREYHADAALVERDGRTYVAVALLESRSASGILSGLIVKLDDLIFSTPRPAGSSADPVPSVP